MSGGTAASRRDELIRERAETTPRDQGRGQISHGAGRGIARIREQRLPFGFALGVDARERRARQVDLAADFDAPGGRAAERERNGADRPDVGGDVFPVHTVAASRAANETTVFVSQRNAEAVD